MSELSGSQWELAYHALKMFQNISVLETDVGDSPKRDLSGTLAVKLEMMGKRPQSFSSSGFTEDDLSVLNIRPTRSLRLKPKDVLEEQAKKIRAVGKDGQRSSVNLYHHLECPQTPVPKLGEATINAFFSHVSGLVSPNETTAKQQIPHTAVDPFRSVTLHGLIDCAAAITDKSVVEELRSEKIETLKSIIRPGLVVAETKSLSPVVSQFVPQAVGEMYACAKALKTNVIRGAVTNGVTWVFIILVMNPNGDGAKYRESNQISIFSIEPPMVITITRPWPDIISGILLDWMRHGFENIGNGDDWFEVKQ